MTEFGIFLLLSFGIRPIFGRAPSFSGMALSNTLEERIPGSVGYPLPGVECRILNEGELISIL